MWAVIPEDIQVLLTSSSTVIWAFCLYLLYSFIFRLEQHHLHESTLLILHKYIWQKDRLSVSIQALQSFEVVFDSVFGDKHLSWRCFRRSVLSTSLLVFGLVLGPEILVRFFYTPDVSALWLSLGYSVYLGVICNNCYFSF